MLAAFCHTERKIDEFKIKSIQSTFTFSFILSFNILKLTSGKMFQLCLAKCNDGTQQRLITCAVVSFTSSLNQSFFFNVFSLPGTPQVRSTTWPTFLRLIIFAGSSLYPPLKLCETITTASLPTELGLQHITGCRLVVFWSRVFIQYLFRLCLRLSGPSESKKSLLGVFPVECGSFGVAF